MSEYIDDIEITDDVLKRFYQEETEEEKEERIKKAREDIERRGYLPVNDEFEETMTSPQEVVEKNPRKYIIESSKFAVGTDDTTKFFLTNSQAGKENNKLSVAEFTTILSNSIKKNADIQSYNSLDFEITSATNKDAPRIATWTIKFKPSVFYNEHSILLDMSADDKKADVGGWVD